jgi:hypothetical protein
LKGGLYAHNVASGAQTLLAEAVSLFKLAGLKAVFVASSSLMDGTTDQLFVVNVTGAKATQLSDAGDFVSKEGGNVERF